jgi:hypothetical protein
VSLQKNNVVTASNPPPTWRLLSSSAYPLGSVLMPSVIRYLWAELFRSWWTAASVVQLVASACAEASMDRTDVGSWN